MYCSVVTLVSLTTTGRDCELHCTNMIFRRQLITAAAAIITLTVLLASTDVSVPPGSIALWLTLVSML